jgi:hypothetical protein
MLAFCASLAAPQALADAANAPELAYRAPEGCPGTAEFTDEIARLTPEWAARRAELAVAVEITPDAHGLAGRVRFARAGRERLELRRARASAGADRRDPD